MQVLPETRKGSSIRYSHFYFRICVSDTRVSNLIFGWYLFKGSYLYQGLGELDVQGAYVQWSSTLFSFPISSLSHLDS